MSQRNGPLSFCSFVRMDMCLGMYRRLAIAFTFMYLSMGYTFWSIFDIYVLVVDDAILIANPLTSILLWISERQYL